MRVELVRDVLHQPVPVGEADARNVELKAVQRVEGVGRAVVDLPGKDHVEDLGPVEVLAGIEPRVAEDDGEQDTGPAVRRCPFDTADVARRGRRIYEDVASKYETVLDAPGVVDLQLRQ